MAGTCGGYRENSGDPITLYVARVQKGVVLLWGGNCFRGITFGGEMCRLGVVSPGGITWGITWGGCRLGVVSLGGVPVRSVS